MDETTTEIIRIEQLPIIREHLRIVRDDIESRIDAAMQMPCTEDTYKAVKSARAELTKEAKAWEEKRKTVKAAIMQPYTEFEEAYKLHIINPFKSADLALKRRIDDVENGIKAEKAASVEKYFYELRESLLIPDDVINFPRAGIRITMSASIRQLQQQCDERLAQVSVDLEAIAREEYSSEILAEYKKHYSFSKAKNDIHQRHEEIKAADDAQRKANAERADAQKRALEAQLAAQNADAQKSATDVMLEEKADQAPIIAAPVDTPVETPAPATDERKVCAAFNVSATIPALKAMKQYFIENCIEFESLVSVEIDGAKYYTHKS